MQAAEALRCVRFDPALFGRMFRQQVLGDTVFENPMIICRIILVVAAA